MKPNEFFFNELKSLYQAEKLFLQLISKMIDLAVSDRLSDLFTIRLNQMNQHTVRLEDVFHFFEIPPQVRKSEGMEGLLAEANTAVLENANTAQIDAALIENTQKIIHYKIACYGCLCRWADVMELNMIADQLKMNLEDDKKFDAELTDIAVNEINEPAFSL